MSDTKSGNITITNIRDNLPLALLSANRVSSKMISQSVKSNPFGIYGTRKANAQIDRRAINVEDNRPANCESGSMSC